MGQLTQLKAPKSEKPFGCAVYKKNILLCRFLIREVGSAMIKRMLKAAKRPTLMSPENLILRWVNFFYFCYYLCQGSIFWSKTDIYSPPPFGNLYFFPLKQRDFRAMLPTTKQRKLQFLEKIHIENFQIVFYHLQALFICILQKVSIDHSLVSIVNHQIVGFSKKQRSVALLYLNCTQAHTA